MHFCDQHEEHFQGKYIQIIYIIDVTTDLAQNGHLHQCWILARVSFVRTGRLKTNQYFFKSVSSEHSSHIIMTSLTKWKHFSRYWPFVRGIHRSPVNSPHKGQWRGALMFSLICVWINGWVNNRDAGDLRCYRPLWRHRNVYDSSQCSRTWGSVWQYQLLEIEWGVNVSINWDTIGSGDDMAPVRYQASIWTIADWFNLTERVSMQFDSNVENTTPFLEK